MSVDKLVDSTQLDSDLTSVANAIRAKTGGSSQLSFPSGFVSAISGIGPSQPTLQNKTVTPTTSQQTVQCDSGYDGLDTVTVNPIPSQYIVPSGTKSITANGTGIDVSQYADADVAVPNSYSSSDEGKVVSNGALVSQGSDTVTANDTYDTTLISSLTVNVSGGGGSPTVLDTAGIYPVDTGDVVEIGSSLVGIVRLSAAKTLTNSWDLTDSLTDSIGSKTITLSNATRTSSGLTIGGANHRATIPIKFEENKTYEFDIASMTKSYSSGHGRFIMTSSDVGLIWRSNGYWAFYAQSAWSASANTNSTYFSGKTVKITTDEYYTAYANGTQTTYLIPKVYVDGTLFDIPNYPLAKANQIYLGATSNAAYTFVCTGIRVYDGV